MLLMGWTSSTCVTTYVEKLLEQRVAFEDMARFARLRLAESLLRSIFCQTCHWMLGGVCSMPAGKAARPQGGLRPYTVSHVCCAQ